MALAALAEHVDSLGVLQASVHVVHQPKSSVAPLWQVQCVMSPLHGPSQVPRGGSLVSFGTAAAYRTSICSTRATFLLVKREDVV